jgi:membrane associated rhomboid family serine protease
MQDWAHEWVTGWSWRLGPIARARWTWSVVVLLVAIHCVVELGGGVQQVAPWYLTGGLRRSEVLTGGFWQIVSYALLHGSWGHLLTNVLCLLVLGSQVEFVLGKAGLLKALGWGILGGAGGHLLLSDGGAGAAPLVGFSGACVALLLVITTLSPESRMWPLPVSARNLGCGILLAELLFSLITPQLGLPGLSLIGELLVKHGWQSWFLVGHACHLGGGVAGWLYARSILRPRVTLESLQQARRRREAGR